jgi:hypothetical protein
MMILTLAYRGFFPASQAAVFETIAGKFYKGLG